jgi:hypothetical protein
VNIQTNLNQTNLLNQMASMYDDIKQVYRHPTYYSYDEELYAKCFPEEWAQNHYPGTGPKECKDCIKNGFWNGVFVGYCVMCANIYEHFDFDTYDTDIETSQQKQKIIYNPVTQEMEYYPVSNDKTKTNISRGRGCGFHSGIIHGENTWIDDPNAAMNTYLEHVKLDNIGDKDMFDSALFNGFQDGCPFTLRQIQEMREGFKKKND